MSTYELEIDGGPAEQGAQRIVKSFEDIKAAANRMEGGVVAAAKKMVSAFRELSGVRSVSADAIKSLRELSSSLGSFRGPSAAATKNTGDFFRTMSQFSNFRAPSRAGLGGFLSALTGFRGPTPSAGTNTGKLLTVLSRFSGVPGATGRVASFMSALGGFRGPPPSAGENTRKLLAALSSFTGAPPGLAGTIRKFIEFSEAVNKAAASMRSLRTDTAKPLTDPTTAARSGARGYTRDHGLLQSAIFKTQTAMNALGGILAARSIIQASNSILGIRAQLEAATGSVQQMRVQFEYLQSTTQRLGLDLVDTAKSYGLFLGSIKGTNVTFKEAKGIFEGFATAARALQLSNTDVEGVFRALGQMLSKGKLQAEELRGQLGDRLPGAFVRFARALDLTKPGQLDDALKKGAISGDRLKNAISRVAQTLKEEFSVSAEKASNTAAAAFNRLRNSFVLAAAGLGSSGLNEALIDVSDALRKVLDSEDLGYVLSRLGKGFKFVGDNITLFSSILAGVAFGSMLKFGVQLFKLVEIFKAVTTGQKLLNAAILKNPYIVIGGAIAAATFYFLKFKDAQNEYAESLKKTSGAQATGQNMLDAYTAKVANLTGVIDDQTKSLNAQYLAQLKVNASQLARIDTGISYGKESAGSVRDRTQVGKTTRVVNIGHGMSTSYDDPIYKTTRNTSGGGVARINGQALDNKYYNLLKNIADVKDGKLVPKKLDTDAGTFERGLKSNVQLNFMLANDKNLPAPIKTALDGLRQIQTGQIDRVLQREAAKDKTLTFSGQKIATDYLGDYNKEIVTGGLDGGAPDAKDKPGAKGAANAYEQDIRRALEKLRDTKREIEDTQRSFDALSKGSEAAIAATARNAAIATVDNFEDSFQTAQKAQEGIQDLARRMGVAGVEAKNSAANFAIAREGIIGAYAALNETNDRTQKDRDIKSSTVGLKEENDLRQRTVTAMRLGGAAAEQMNIALEIEQKLVGGTEAERQKLREGMAVELTRQREINRELETASVLNSQRTDSQTMSDQSGLYSAGLNDRDVEYYKSLIAYRNKLMNDGYTGAMLAERMEAEVFFQSQIRANEDLLKQYEKMRQLAQDQADAIVDGFRDGAEAGDSFLTTMKNIFGDLKRVMLDAVLYNPLREFLTDTFTQFNSRSVSGASGVKSRGLDFLAATEGSGFGSTSSNSSGVSSEGLAKSLAAVAGLSGAFSKNGDATKAIASATETGNILATEQTIDIYGRVMTDATTVGTIKAQAKPEYFSKLKSVFSGTGGAEIGKLFQKGGMTQANAAGALGAAGNAFAAYGVGSQVGKALGLGKTGQSTLGGAAAGFSLGGPVGAAIGAAVGFAKGILFKKKTPTSFANIFVDETGTAQVGTAGKQGKGKVEEAKALGSAAAGIFNDFAVQVGAKLTAGSYGQFGKVKDQAYYSVSGATKKGKPVGVEGRDFIYGTDSQLNAFALKRQINDGKYSGLSNTYKTVAANSRATELDDLQSDFQTGADYDAFIEGAKKLSDMAKQVQELNKSYTALRQKSLALGLAENALVKARDKLLAGYKEEFNRSISQGILKITDPRQAEFNDLVLEYRTQLENAIAVGGDITKVEEYYGLRRVELAKQYAEEVTNNFATSAKEMLTSLTAGPSSPLAPQTILRNASDQFATLKNELTSGNFSNADNLQTYAQNYLEAARTMNASSVDYFRVFDEVTQLLSEVSAGRYAAASVATDLPALPALQDLIASINAQNSDLIDVTTDQTGVLEGIGGAIAEEGSVNAQLLQGILLRMDQLVAAQTGSGLLAGGSAGLATALNIGSREQQK